MCRALLIGIVLVTNVAFLPLYALLPILFLIYWFYPSDELEKSYVWVVVLGDLGHSPRTVNQALSLINSEKQVVLFGFKESSLPAECKTENGLKIVNFPDFKFSNIKSQLLRYILKTIFQFISILFVYIRQGQRTGNPSHILVQNPPSIPTLIVTSLFVCATDAKLVIDWHNYGFSIMRIQKQNKLIVKIAEIYEKWLARMSDLNFTVTKAMKKEITDWGASNVHVLYDKPHPRFHEMQLSEKETFLSRLSNTIPILKKAKDSKLIVSSTSWTKDEDFGILLDALVKIDKSLRTKFIVVITGKGPEKTFYLNKIKQLDMVNVEICTPWLEIEDYPLLLGCADLGVCLHTSSSGVDLPMKVVDMFGAGVPCCALNFEAIQELVIDDKNGKLFNNSEELSLLLTTLLIDKGDDLARYREFLRENRISWSDHWKETAMNHFH